MHLKHHNTVRYRNEKPQLAENYTRLSSNIVKFDIKLKRPGAFHIEHSDFPCSVSRNKRLNCLDAEVKVWT